MTYQQTLEYLYNQLPAFHRVGKAAYKGDLETTITLDNQTGNPHRSYRTIHIAGTNGKGSVSHMIASILQEAGYRTGLYTSPHLRDFRERIRINGEMIPENAVIEFVENYKQLFEKLSPSFFEMTVAMAFRYFADIAVDVAVIEVGLGGRLDSTNIIFPVLSVITNIGHDHMDLLGDTLVKIAYEKAGIIKESVPAVISETQPELKEIFVEKALEKGSVISFADERFSIILNEDFGQQGERKYTATDISTGKKYEGITPLGGDYQAYNIRAVYNAVLFLRNEFIISDENIADGILRVTRNTGFSGRWQVLGHDPLIICDTAHNKEGLECVLRQIDNLEKTGLHLVLGFVNDKDLTMVLPLFPSKAKYYFTKASIPRALNEDRLKEEASKYRLYGDSYSDVKTALEAARARAGRSDVIFVGGSTFVVAEVV